LLFYNSLDLIFFMDRARFLFIVSGLFLVVVLALGLIFFLVPDSVPKGIFGHVTVLGECDLVGDNPPCGTVSLSEVVSLINQWIAGDAILSDVIKLINAWASPGSTTTTTSTVTSSSTTTSTSTTSTTSTTICFGAEECNPTGDPIGGGANYSDIITQTNPNITYIVSTKAQLLSALSNASSGNIIFVPENASINLSGTWGTQVPAGVTLASNRGFNGSIGGRVFGYNTNNPGGWGESISMLVITGNNVRITGLRLEGSETGKVYSGYEGTFGVFDYGHTGVEIDNNEIWGWGQAAVTEWMGNDASSNATQIAALATEEIGSGIINIHHNYIHHCQIEAEGYGVNVVRGSALVKANLFDYTRHAIAAGGYDWEGYEATYNVYIGSNAYSHIFDVHGQNGGMGGIAGNTYRIVHNTFLSNTSHAIFIRGVPINDALITLNRMNNCYETTGDLCWGDPPNAVQQYNSTGHITMLDNIIDGAYVAGPQILNEIV
jgi:hypothetical protein